MTLTRNFNTDDNFWETNPIFKTVKIFREFYESDKSRKKGNSSRIMWAIAFLIDQHEENIWRNLTEEDKKTLIAEEYLENKEFEWHLYQDIIGEYEKRIMTVAERDFVELMEKMHERKNFIKNTPYTLDTTDSDGKTIKGTAKDLDTMVVNTTKLYDQLEIVKQKLERSKQLDGETRGGMKESATEQGLL